MRVITFDPISLNDISDLANAPYLVEIKGEDRTKIYFENNSNRAKYRRITLAAASVTLTGAYARIAEIDKAGTADWRAQQ